MVEDETLHAADEAALAELIERAAAELAGRGTTVAFSTLVGLSGLIGTQLGEAARQMAGRQSWSQVAAVSGTTKQAAWARWH